MYSYQMGIFPYNLMRKNLGYSYYPTNINPVISKTTADLNNSIRSLWEQHVIWTRLAILSMVFGLPDEDLVTKRLLRNPNDFAVVLNSFYGEQVAARFDYLLTSHLVIASELVKAAKSGDSTAAADAEKRWYSNADEIATFLANINPYWTYQEWKAMLNQHLALTKAEAVDMLTGKYLEGITTFDQIEKQALDMADMMTNGIMKQFPI